MPYKYALSGPPFNFQGQFSETQKNALNTWVTDNQDQLPKNELWHRMRAYQLRKTAGMLEQFYASDTPDSLATSFLKQAWQPGPYGHWSFGQRDDHIPAITVGKLKDHFRYMMQRQDEAVFHMNHLRNQIERQEDLAQYASEAPAEVTALLAKVEALFGQPEYQAVLVKDISDQYKGEPRFRVHQMDTPTQWELEQHNHGATADSPILLGASS